MSGCRTGPWAQGWPSKRFRGWRVPVTDGRASLGQCTRTQRGIALSALILTWFYLAFDFHGNIL